MTKVGHFEVCGVCHRAQCSCPPQSPASPDQPATKREQRTAYEDGHKCIGCIHAGVCEVGRHTAELYVAGWEIRIDDCSEFIDLQTIFEDAR